MAFIVVERRFRGLGSLPLDSPVPDPPIPGSSKMISSTEIRRLQNSAGMVPDPRQRSTQAYVASGSMPTTAQQMGSDPGFAPTGGWVMPSWLKWGGLGLLLLGAGYVVYRVVR